MDGELAKAIVKAPFVLVYKTLRAIVSNRILLIVIVGLAIFLIAKSQFGDKSPTLNGIEAAPYQALMPPVASAPRIVQTTSRYYPYSTFTDDGKHLILTDYYTYDGDSWQHFTTSLPIDKSRIIKVYNR
jgi:hypothetical protein